MGRREESEKEDTCGRPGAIEEKRERAPVLRDYSSEKRAACEYRSDKGHGEKEREFPPSRTAREAREEIPLSRGRATGISKSARTREEMYVHHYGRRSLSRRNAAGYIHEQVAC